MERKQIPSREVPLMHMIATVKPLYESSDRAHAWDHIESCLRNVDALESAGDKSNPHAYAVARATILIHDLDHAKKTPTEIETLLRSLGMSDGDVHDISTAISNHNKPKQRWSDPNHAISQIVYDADKMDTVRERFSSTKQVDGKQVETTESDFIGYVFMVRDSMTSRIASETITRQLPEHLRIDLTSPKTTMDAIRSYEDSLREVWRDVNLPMKKSVAKYILMITSNHAYTREILDTYPPITREQMGKLTPVRRKWMTYLNNLQNGTEYFIQHMQDVARVAKDPMTDRSELAASLHEKLYVYETLKHALVSYPKSREADLELILDRTVQSERIHRNYSDYMNEVKQIHVELGPDELRKRKEYFRGLTETRFRNIDHFSPIGNIDALKGGRRIMDHAIADLYKNSDSSSILDIIDYTIEADHEIDARGIMRHFRQNGLRAVDRVNDALRTDRFIYSMASGQTIDAPVNRLPYIYHLNADTLSDNGIHYFSPTHPQALHAMKMRLPFHQSPQIFDQTLRFFAQGMYMPDEYIDLIADMFATQFDETELDAQTMEYMLTHIVVNEDATLTRHPSGRFTSDEWLELDHSSRKDPLWNAANTALAKINRFSKKVGIIPPLRPYAACDKQIDIDADRISITKNPAAPGDAVESRKKFL